MSMWFYALSFLLRVSLALLAYWPGGERGFEPVYDHRIPVINTLKPLANLRPAIQQWNACGSVQLRLAPGTPPYQPGSITITKSDDGGAYGGWGGDHGVVFLGDGWTHTRGVITHEMGHALGFGHGGHWSSIMGWASNVQPLDCEGLRRYYG